MNFFKQTRSDNCLETCASILTGIDVSLFPNLSEISSEDAKFFKVLNGWLTKNYGLYLETIKYEDDENFYNRGLGIAVGDSPNQKGELHAVLWDSDRHLIVFDPAPSNKGLIGEPTHFIIIVKHFSVPE